jgi:excinuclease ABC subunit C
MSLAHRLFGIRSCNEVIDGRRGRPCLEYDIGRCLAPCVESICTIERYRHAVDQAQLLIDGRQDELIEGLRTDMTEAAGAERYERAAHLRDAIRTIETVRDRHNKVESPAMGDRDAFGVKVGPAGAIVEVFQMRRGRVCDRLELVTEARDLSGASETEVLSAALQQFYADRPAPPDVHVPTALEGDEHGALEAWLSGAAGRRVRVTVPRRGEKRGLLDLATRNAALAYPSHFGEGATAAFEALDALRTVLHLPALPRRIECFDISTLQGRETVASMVVAVEGRLRRGEYRTFRIRGPARPAGGDRDPADGTVLDDFASMREVVLRRYRRLLDQGGPFPDLILIDGGKGQLASAYAALGELGLERLVAVGLAKQEELLFMRDRADGVALAPESAALRLVQRIRDEAHRVAVTFHRRRRTMRDFRSELDDVAGIGHRRRRQLLTAFGSVAGVRRASRAELAAVVGPKAADAVIQHFADGLGLKA